MSTDQQRAATTLTPEIEACLDALTHLDAAKALVEPVNGQVSDAIFQVKCQLEVEAGFLLAQEARRQQYGSSPQGDTP